MKLHSGLGLTLIPVTVEVLKGIHGIQLICLFYYVVTVVIAILILFGICAVADVVVVMH